MKKLILLSIAFTIVTFSATAQFDDSVRDEVTATPAFDDPNGVFRTQTIGGWGSKPRIDKDGNVTGNNPGSYLHANWDALFGDGGITIGSGDNTLSFSDAWAVTGFLPSGGTPRALDESMQDPEGRDVKNTLASQVLAATISVKVGQVMPEYLNLGQAITVDDITVQEALDIANRILAGESVGDHTATSINEIITQINESNVDAEQQTDYVTQKL